MLNRNVKIDGMHADCGSWSKRKHDRTLNSTDGWMGGGVVGGRKGSWVEGGHC